MAPGRCAWLLNGTLQGLGLRMTACHYLLGALAHQEHVPSCFIIFYNVLCSYCFKWCNCCDGQAQRICNDIYIRTIKQSFATIPIVMSQEKKVKTDIVIYSYVLQYIPAFACSKYWRRAINPPAGFLFRGSPCH